MRRHWLLGEGVQQADRDTQKLGGPMHHNGDTDLPSCVCPFPPCLPIPNLGVIDSSLACGLGSQSIRSITGVELLRGTIDWQLASIFVLWPRSYNPLGHSSRHMIQPRPVIRLSLNSLLIAARRYPFFTVLFHP